MGKRNPSVELFRASLMFGICLLHVVNFGGYPCRWLVNALCSCVVGFVFISGWYGVRFSWLKLAKLYGIGFYCALVLGLLSRDLGEGMRQFVHGWWFLHAYALMMILTPFVNAVVDPLPALTRNSLKQYLVISPLLFFVWVWGFGRTLPCGTSILPKTDGIDAYGGITLLAIYVAARVVRKSGLVEHLRERRLVLGLFACLVLTAIGLGDYNSPVAFFLAGIVFVLFNRLNLTEKLADLLIFLGPSMFSVYLIHTSRFGFGLLEKAMHYLVMDKGLAVLFAWPIVACLVFILAVGCDMPRRLLGMAFHVVLCKLNLAKNHEL